jgi:hypothetical protein
MNVGKGGPALALGVIAVRCDRELDRLARLVAEGAAEVGTDIGPLRNPCSRPTRSAFGYD